PGRGDPSGPGVAPLFGVSDCDIEAIQCADYTLGRCQLRNGVLVCSFGGDGTGGGTDEKPLGGAFDAAPSAAATSDAKSVIAFLRKGGGLLEFVAEIALSCGEFGLARFAVECEVVERFQVFGRYDGAGLWRRRVWRRRGGVAKGWGGGGVGGAGGGWRTIGDGRGIWLGRSWMICAGVTMVRFSAARTARD